MSQNVASSLRTDGRTDPDSLLAAVEDLDADPDETIELPFGFLKALIEQVTANTERISEQEEHSARDRASIRQDVTEAKETAETAIEAAEKSSALQGKEEENAAPAEPETPIERVSELDDDKHGIDVTPSVRRAVTLYENLRDWSVKTPRGYVLKTKNGLKDLLSAATEENLSWKQVYRACRALDDMAKGSIEFHRDNPRHGKMLVIPEENQRQSSSVAT